MPLSQKHYDVLLQQVETDSASVGISAATSISYALNRFLVCYVMKRSQMKSTHYFSYIYV
jgi:hypothetical protein